MQIADLWFLRRQQAWHYVCRFFLGWKCQIKFLCQLQKPKLQMFRIVGPDLPQISMVQFTILLAKAEFKNFMQPMSTIII